MHSINASVEHREGLSPSEAGDGRHLPRTSSACQRSVLSTVQIADCCTDAISLAESVLNLSEVLTTGSRERSRPGRASQRSVLFIDHSSETESSKRPSVEHRRRP